MLEPFTLTLHDVGMLDPFTYNKGCMLDKLYITEKLSLHNLMKTFTFYYFQKILAVINSIGEPGISEVGCVGEHRNALLEKCCTKTHMCMC